MSALFLLIAVSLLVAIGFLVAFLWAASSGQYDDEYSNSVRILFDDKSSKDQKSNDPKSE
jgi:cbb3-type cytochrome oxidase maturation protein